MIKPKEDKSYLGWRGLHAKHVVFYLGLVACSGGLLAYFLYHRSRLALIREMFRGHSSARNILDILRPAIDPINIAASLTVMMLVLIVTLLVFRLILRAASALAGNLRSARDGQDPAEWPQIRHPHEFRYLQSLLADSLMAHRDRIETLGTAGASLGDTARRIRGEAGPTGLDPSRLAEFDAGLEKLRSAFNWFKLE